MAVNKTPRLGLKTYSSGNDLHPDRTEFNARQELFERLVAMAFQGATSERPASGKIGQFFYDTDRKRLYWDNGTGWVDLNPNGGGGAALDVVVDGTGSEGASSQAARADHTHNLPLASSSAHGAMSKSDKAKLDAATYYGTPDTLARRGAKGTLAVASPTVSVDAANKDYVDTETAKKSDNGHKHSGADITTGTINPARIANASAATDGLLAKSDKTKLDDATYLATGGTLVQRSGAGQIYVGKPQNDAAATTKAYVDELIAETIRVKGDLLATDLDTVREAGEWYTTGSNHVTTANHYPTNGAPGALKVILFAGTGNWIIQQWTEWSTLRVWMRSTNMSTGGWKPWREIAGTETATRSADGLMSAADKAKLDDASSVASANKLLQANSKGDIAVNAPSSGSHPTNKSYVDTQIATRAATKHTHTLDDLPTVYLGQTANLDDFVTSGFFHQTGNVYTSTAQNYPANVAGMLTVLAEPGGGFVFQQYQGYSANNRLFWRSRYSGKWSEWNEASTEGHTHSWSQITGKPSTFTPSGHTHSANDVNSGTLAAARLPVVTTAVQGAMSAADKKKLDAATRMATAGTLAERSTTGEIYVADPSTESSAANRRYVDGEIKTTRRLMGALTTEDLNTVLAFGDYYTASSGNATAARNYPITGAGILRVSTFSGGTNWVIQEWTEWSSGRSFVRGYNGTWQAWNEFATTDPATSSRDGLMRAADKKLLDAATPSNVPGTILTRNSEGSTRTTMFYMDGDTTTNGDSVVNRRHLDDRMPGGIAAGSVTITPKNPYSAGGISGYRGEATVVFPRGRFSSGPAVVAGPITTIPGSTQGTGAYSTSTTGCVITAARWNTSSMTIHWIATDATS